MSRPARASSASNLKPPGGPAGMRVAWLVPFATRAWYWHPLLAEFTRRFPRTTVFSCLKTGLPAPVEGSYEHRYAGRGRHIALFWRGMRPGLAVTLLPLGIFVRLLRFRPRVIITGGFNLWSALSLILGSLSRREVIILYDGSSPHVDMVRRSFRIASRRLMARVADGLVTNSEAGRSYLVDVLGADSRRVFRRPYLVPSWDALGGAGSGAGGGPPPRLGGLRRPVFLYVGRPSYRKGTPFLLDACALLLAEGRRDFSLVVVGTGPELVTMQERAWQHGLDGIVRWAGWVDYGKLGSFLDFADVFVFPSLTDVWGMAVLEAMAFSKPVICSRYAGASEMVVEGGNGFVFDPYQPALLARTMARFMDEPDLAAVLGRGSGDLLRHHNPGTAMEGLAQVVRFVTARDPLRRSSSRTRSRSSNPPDRSR